MGPIKINTTIFTLGMFILLSILLSSCKEEDEPEPEIKLSLISQYSLSIPEPSGLSFFRSQNEFLTVSDETNKIYAISNKGEVLGDFSFSGDDLEGITYDPIQKNIFIIEEENHYIFRLDTNGVELNRFPVDLYYEEINHGPEGISFNPETNHLFIVTEKKPGKLLEMNLNGEIINNYNLSFADDYSALFFDPIDQKLWILSDESKTLTRCDLTGKALNKYNTGITKGEGLVVDPQNNMVYIVSDQENMMYVLSIP